MSDDILQQIQQMQFTDRSGAEALLLSFIRDNFAFDVVAIELRPQAISLNSFNGFMTLRDGRRYFFKTHTESDTIIGEYYNAELLAKTGYPVIRPIFSSTETGKQFLVYELIDSPSVFDLAWSIETGLNHSDEAALAEAQNLADKNLWQLYQQSLEWQTADEAQQAPIHQLFYHRIVGGRLERFYSRDTIINLPNQSTSMAEVRQAHWVINGQYYTETLDDIIARAEKLLHPYQEGASIIGHGDAHNGNVFFQNTTPPAMLYFDPAFAGRHHPLLDLVKPLFHNVFAMWMYYPQEKQQVTPIALRIEGNTWHIDYRYDLPPVRHMFLQSKVQYVLKPLLKHLKMHNWLRTDWRAYLKAALFCCPFLTMNLADSKRFPPTISLLGLAMSVEMGAESQQHRSLIDTVLDEAAAELA